jgi:hypothetical protein
MNVSEARRLKELEGENGKLKRLLAEAHLDVRALKSVFGRVKVNAALATPVKREAIATMVMEHEPSERRASIGGAIPRCLSKPGTGVGLKHTAERPDHRNCSREAACGLPNDSRSAVPGQP